MQNPHEDTEWNDILRSKGIIPEKQEGKEKEITENQIINLLENTIDQRTGRVANNLVDKSLDELDELEDEEDEKVLEEYRRRRIAEIKAMASKAKYGHVIEISAQDYVSEVNNAGEDVWVVLHLYKSGIPLCALINQYLASLARKFPSTKFLKSISTTCIPNWPDKNLPTLFIYCSGSMVKQIIGPIELRGMKLTESELEWMLGQVGAVPTNITEDPKPKVRDVLFSNLRGIEEDDVAECNDWVLTERGTSQKIRNAPNILTRKRSRGMDISRIITSTSVIKNNTEMKKQIFDPVRSELLTWESYHISEPMISNVNIHHMNIGKKQSSEAESGASKYSPMWCPTNFKTYSNGRSINIVETVTVNFPFGEMTSSVCNEFIEPEFYDFHREMNISISDVKNIDVETVLELGRFECYEGDDDQRVLMQEDPFDEIVIRNSWSKFECLTCGKIYSSQSALNHHLKTKHHRIVKNSSIPVIVLTCPRCFKIFKTYSGYDRHMIRCNIVTQLREE